MEVKSSLPAPFATQPVYNAYFIFLSLSLQTKIKNLSLKKLKTVEKYTMERVFEIKDIGQYQFFVSPLIQNFLDGSIRVNINMYSGL